MRGDRLRQLSPVARRDLPLIYTARGGELSVQGDPDQPCILAEFAVESEAQLTRELLGQAGVAAEVLANHSLGAGLELGGRGSYRLLVRRGDLAAAGAVLAAREQPGSGETPIEGEACPQCGATAVVASRLSGREVALRKVVRMFVMPWHRTEPPEVDPVRRCTECWYRW